MGRHLSGYRVDKRKKSKEILAYGYTWKESWVLRILVSSFVPVSHGSRLLETLESIVGKKARRKGEMKRKLLFYMWYCRKTPWYIQLRDSFRNYKFVNFTNSILIRYTLYWVQAVCCAILDCNLFIYLVGK